MWKKSQSLSWNINQNSTQALWSPHKLENSLIQILFWNFALTKYWHTQSSLDKVFSCNFFTWTLNKESTTVTGSIGDLQLHLNLIIQSKSSLQVEILHKHISEQQWSRVQHPTFWMGLQKHLHSVQWHLSAFLSVLPLEGSHDLWRGKGLPELFHCFLKDRWSSSLDLSAHC